MRILGIDPGVTGAWAFLGHESIIMGDLEVVSIGASNQILPEGLVNTLDLCRPDVVVLEHNGVMPTNGSKANYSMGLSTGIIIGVVRALSYPLVRMRPQEWKALVGLSGVKGTDAEKKEASRQRALELVPITADGFLSRKKDHNRADAFLIAEAHRRRG